MGKISYSDAETKWELIKVIAQALDKHAMPNPPPVSSRLWD